MFSPGKLGGSLPVRDRFAANRAQGIENRHARRIITVGIIPIIHIHYFLTLGSAAFRTNGGGSAAIDNSARSRIGAFRILPNPYLSLFLAHYKSQRAILQPVYLTSHRH
jgi:hypothetical protein